MGTANIKNEYFEWMYELVTKNRYAEENSYRRLIEHLHTIEFVYSIPKDDNRAADGVCLRGQYAYIFEIPNIYESIPGPSSVLEMILALAIRMENSIMEDTRYGDRTGQWFWYMINNLGLGSMYDRNYSEEYVDEVVNKFMNHDYAYNGNGGLFTVTNPESDMREVEIWVQMLRYINTIR